jgi:16S rRNA (guanine527-N7)-methyltransferase
MFHVKHPTSRSTEARLAAYAELVRRWAPKLDLVAPSDLARLEERHLEDSLKAVPLLEVLPSGPAIDVGSGAGLPGIPLALASRSRVWRLLEPRSRRAAFLEECVRVLELDCEVLRMTAEEAARRPQLRASHVCALARALAPPERAFRLLCPLVRPDGVAAVFVSTQSRLPVGAERMGEGLAIMRVMEHEGHSRLRPP